MQITPLIADGRDAPRAHDERQLPTRTPRSPLHAAGQGHAVVQDDHGHH